MIELKKLRGGYGREEKLHDISFSIGDASILSIVGPNGCGKSTLLKTLCGLLKPFSGTILLDDTPLEQIHRGELAKRISYLPQSRNIPSITAGSMVLHGRFPYLGYPRRYRAEDHKLAMKAMAWAGVADFYHRPMSELSGGERQNVYLAMLLAQDTKTILLDEPTTYLDISHQLEMMRLVRQLRDTGKTVLMVQHDLHLALSHSDYVCLMDSGHLLALDSPERILATGLLDRVFGVRVLSETSGGRPRYYFEAKI